LGDRQLNCAPLAAVSLDQGRNLPAAALLQFGFFPSPSFDRSRFVAAALTIRSITTLAAPVCF
jgi:hypothetical protein